LPFNFHQEVKLLSPREMLKRGLNDILEDFLQKNNCDDLTALSQSAAFLCKLIHKNPRFGKEEYPKLEIYESRALKAAFNDATDHLFLSFCGFEIFAKSMQEGRLFSLGLLLRMLIQDWHGTSEQARRVHSIVKFQKTNDSHHLLDFNEMENGATKEYLQAIDNGLVWSRYPISNAESQLPHPPLGLHWMKFCYKFQSKIIQKKPGIITDKEIHQIHQLIDFICNCQFNVWIDACHLLSKDCDFIRFPEVLERVKAQMKVWASALQGKQFAELGAENVLQPQQEILDLLSTLKQKLVGTSQEVKAEAGNIKRHLTELHAAVWLKHKNDKKRFDALFDRNLLNLQWVLESSYRILAAMKNINRIKDHDLSVIQRFLRIAGANISDGEEHDTASYNLREMQYYPHYVKFTRGNLSKSMVDMLAKIKLAQRLCLHAETDLISPAIPDQTFQNGLRVVSHHFSLIPNKTKSAR
ncbi:MAG: hypothetical protein LLG04_06390, partial [Parachlamydia sp.]|nr:hypothetical protein [Parachlamydia sp.]